MRESMVQPSERILADIRKSLESWAEAKELVYCSGYNPPSLFRNLQRTSFACMNPGTLQKCYPKWSTVMLFLS